MSESGGGFHLESGANLASFLDISLLSALRLNLCSKAAEFDKGIDNKVPV